MILFNKNLTGNTIYSTASQAITITGQTEVVSGITETSGFTLSLKSDFNNYAVSGITLTDISEYTQRYNNFTFDNDLLSQFDEGLHRYDIYYSLTTETSSTATTATTIVVQTEHVENGIAKLFTSGEIIPTFKYTDNDDEPKFVYVND